MIKKTLKNGLKVFFEKRKTDSVAIEINVKTGSVNESKELGGISHLLEHLVFKNTKNRTQKQITSAIEDLGGDLNAFTDNERTSFHAQVLKKHFPIAFEILSDIVLNPLLLEKDILQEKKVIMREIDMVKDNPLRYQTDLLPKTLFRFHPLGNLIIGTKENIRNMTREQILSYYKTHYIPNNICISIVGDAKNPFREVEKFFSSVKPSTPPKKLLVHEPNLTKPVFYKEKRSIENSYLSIGFKIPPRNHRDSFAIDVINTILGDGMSSRLWQEIREKMGLVYTIHSATKFTEDTGYFLVYSGIKKENIPTASRIILEEIQKLAKITEQELATAKTKIEGAYLLEIENNIHMATEMNYWETTANNPEMVHKYPEMLKKITTRDIQSSIHTYFNPNTYAQVTIEEK